MGNKGQASRLVDRLADRRGNKQTDRLVAGQGGGQMHTQMDGWTDRYKKDTMLAEHQLQYAVKQHANIDAPAGHAVPLRKGHISAWSIAPYW